jgi:hypothetical protein
MQKIGCSAGEREREREREMKVHQWPTGEEREYSLTSISCGCPLYVLLIDCEEGCTLSLLLLAS